MHLILFDIDGTLLHGHGVGSRAMVRAGRTLLGDAFTLDGIDFGGALDPWIFAQAASRLGVEDCTAHHEEFKALYLVELEREILSSEARPHALPGITDLLSLLARRADVTLALVTGNYTQAAPLKLSAAGLDPATFPFGAFGDDAPTRPELVQVAMQRSQSRGRTAEPDRVIVVGDTPRDVDCAHSNGCRCLAVATGWHSVETLAAARADVVVKDLTDPTALLAMLG